MTDVGSDDDVQFLYLKPSSNSTFLCQICEQDIGKQSEQQRQAHYDKHFSEQPQRVQAPSRASSSRITKDVFWHPSADSELSDNFTPGLIPLLKKSLTLSHLRGQTIKAALCHPQAVHTTVSWDRKWGCGYRNFLMACIPLIEQASQPTYPALLKDPIPPGIRNLQLWIEDAWASGYDEEGARQLDRHLVDTTKWIGTAELFVAFTSRGVPSQLIDFYLDSKGSENKLVNWVIQYFSPPAQPQQTVTDALRGAQAITVTERMPVVLQHHGHSRTIVGYEITKSGSVNLLLFDPSRPPKHSIRKAALATTATSMEGSSLKKFSSMFERNVFRPLHEISSNKRKASESVSEIVTVKRSRGGKEVIVIDDAEDDVEMTARYADDKCFKDVLKFARVPSSTLGKRDKYQVLYFPLTAPLTEAEKRNRRVVTSQKM